jgi:hypothetical protein
LIRLSPTITSSSRDTKAFSGHPLGIGRGIEQRHGVPADRDPPGFRWQLARACTFSVESLQPRRSAISLRLKPDATNSGMLASPTLVKINFASHIGSALRETAK